MLKDFFVLCVVYHLSGNVKKFNYVKRDCYVYTKNQKVLLRFRNNKLVVTTFRMKKTQNLIKFLSNQRTLGSALFDQIVRQMICTKFDQNLIKLCFQGWERIVKMKWNKITEVSVSDRQFHTYDIFDKQPILKTTNLAAVQKVMKYIGPQVKSMTLGDCLEKLLYFNNRSGYRLPKEFDAEKLITTFTQTCENIEQLQLKSCFITDARLDGYNDYKMVCTVNFVLVEMFKSV